MKENIFNKIVEHVKSMNVDEYNKLLEQSKEMEKDYQIQLKNARKMNEEG